MTFRRIVVIIATTTVVLAAPSSCGATTVARAAEPERAAPVPNVIIDTDLSRWWDDVTVMGLANVLDGRGKVNLLGIVSDVPNRAAVAAIDAIDTAYGHGRVPVGAVAGSHNDTFAHGYTDALTARLPHSIDNSDDAPSAVSVYRRLLANEPDHSVTVVSLGGYTNLAGLLRSKHGQGSSLAGRALVARKVQRLVVMDGLFPAGGPAFTNQKLDPEAAGAVVGQSGWPTRIAWVDGLGGVQTIVGSALCTTVRPEHPMRIAYEALFGCGPPTDGDWDAPAFLYAIGDIPRAFSELGQGGAAVINAQGGLSWDADSGRSGDVYVHVVDQAMLNQRIDRLLAVR